MELSCNVQNYEWGKKGADSKVAQLQKSANEGFEVKESLPYAELWMGTHVNAPSIIKSTKQKLSDAITEHPEYLGDDVLREFNELPFLFKVLSVDKALSIQAHPSKDHAAELHSKFPNIYKDPNHKPEMAIALTPFEALCGFKPLPEVKSFIKDIPELQCIIGHETLNNECQLVQNAFRAVLTCSKEKIRTCIDSLFERFQTYDQNQRQAHLVSLVERLHSQFPYDNGILMVYFLNYLKLSECEAIFLGANEPHAYLFGDCVECMACSDNVVRAGLTPKFVDVDTLCDMLIYKGEKPEDKLFSPIREDAFSVIFKPPVPDFAVVQIEVPEGETSFETAKRSSASIILVVSGEADYVNGKVVPGTVLFLPANNTIDFTNLKGTLFLYQALANV
ncbi:hypothetical protein GWI33_004248 [Rhynchophorus ferrugineus]|uniref:Mannose-6-phosphate isomerase n=1 Tax=Rhynchophorus ferrugineus TaxID=354439 RepID=A0A834IJ33_RHYFE|nr:hypothetical protein GWI33_004248 [Rhynchophorus ferrugineus]